VLALLPE